MPNIGTSVWSTLRTAYTFYNVNPAPRAPPVSPYSTLFRSSVNPGSNGSFTIQFTAPTTPGTYTETWQMNSVGSPGVDRKSTRLNSSHPPNAYADVCTLK